MQALMCMLRLGGATRLVHDLLKVIIASEIEAGHVTAWSKGGRADRENC